MLYFVIGRSGSGKTTYIREFIAGHVRSGRGDATLIVPEQFSFETERAMLATLGTRDFSNVNILSFSRLAERLIRETPYATEVPADNSNFPSLAENLLCDTPYAEKPLINDGARAALMSLAVDSLKDSLKVYYKHNKTPALIAEMLFLDGEMKNNSLSPAEMADAAGKLPDGSLKLKAEEFSKILDLYNALVANSYTDDRDMLGLLRDYLKVNHVFKGKIVALDAFRGFLKSEYEVLEQIMRQAEAVYVCVSAESMDDGDNGIGVFSHTIGVINKLRKIAGRNNIEIASPVRLPLAGAGVCRPNDLNALEKMIYNPRAAIYAEPAPNITLYAAENKYDECDYVAGTAKKLIRENGWRCRDIAVIERTAGVYRPELVSAFRKYGLPVFEDTRHNIASEPLAAMLSSALEIAAKGFKTETLTRYLKSGLSLLSLEEISQTENYVMMWQIEGAAWKKDWTAHPEGYGTEFRECHFSELERLNAFRKRIIAPLLTLRESLFDADGRAACRAVYEFLTEAHTPKRLRTLVKEYSDMGEAQRASECSRAWDTLMDILDTLAVTAGNESLGALRFFELFKTVLFVTDIGTLPQGLDEITLGSADRIRAVPPKAVFLVGMNADEFPLSPGPAVIFTDRERSRLRECGFPLSDTNEAKAVEERHITYSALTLAREKLFVSYPKASSGGEQLAPSEVPEFLMAYFSNCNIINSAEVRDIERIESRESGFEAAAKLYNTNSDLSFALGKYFDGLDGYKSSLAAIGRAASREAVKIADADVARALFGADMKLSASRIEKYNNCPFQYFCQYGIAARPRKTAQLDSLQAGSLMHYIFEYIFRNYTTGALQNMNADEIRSIIDMALDEYTEDKLGGAENMPKRTVFLLRSYAKTAYVVLERIIYEFSNSKFKISDVELKIGDGGKIPEYSVTLDDGSVISLNGYIDRVDLMDAGETRYFRIIDYKTGGKNLKLAEVFAGLNMQMLIYLMAVWQNGSESYGSLTPAGILYMPARLGKMGLGRNSSEQEIYEAKIKEGKMNGLILASEDVIGGMEEGTAGAILPASLNDAGKASGSVISLKAFEYLHEIVDGKIREMAQKLHNGEIPVLPARSGSRLACEYCDYRSVCGYEEGGECSQVPGISDKEAMEMLEMGGESNG